MKLTSMIKVSAIAMALVSAQAFADEQPTISVTINGKTYTIPAPEQASGNSEDKSGCTTCGNALTFESSAPINICGSGCFTIPAKFADDDFQKRMEELAKDPDATVVKDDDGNITSVKLSKSHRSGQIVKDGKVVKSWGDEGADEDCQKAIDDAFAECRARAKAAGIDLPEDMFCGMTCGTVQAKARKDLAEDRKAKLKAKIEAARKERDEAARKAKASERKVKEKLEAASKAKASERKAIQDEMNALRQQLDALAKRLEAADSAE